MTPSQQKTALRLYRAYKTNVSEYRTLAESMGITTGELNAKCWWILAAKRKQRVNQQAAQAGE